ncbi:hypothetical protein BX661DRAFT_171824 [Kickxella alabastrina]|uniref:uncharacterized protein n=1 Tax=Kickxella alabastrina TaxID=61397 RepID=UPI00221E56BA|nr:uncharacterized protein BX661DRAFT_171824 [Kickxella alabastrina]KAI7825860.1 hypothetical protein BX661DRAFT_171824 [Kickxella alabastrina]
MSRHYRHRHTRLVWTTSMQSHITLIDLPIQPTSAATPTPVTPAAPVLRPTHTHGGNTFGADNLAANLRPIQLRNNTHGTRATRSQTLPPEIIASSSSSAAAAAAAIAAAANTNAAAGSGLREDTGTQNVDSTSETKSSVGFVRRIKDSLKKQLRTLGHSVLYLPENSRASPYHSVYLN